MDWEFLSRTTLFQGSTPQELQEILSCLGAECRRFARGDRIYRMGDEVHSLGLVLSGRVQVESDDLWGNHSILDSIGPGRVFAEAYACAPGEPMQVDVSAVADSEVLFLNVDNITDSFYVERSKDGSGHDVATLTGYWGNGRSVNFGLRLSLGR